MVTHPIPAPERRRQETDEFEASLNYIVKLCLKKRSNKQKLIQHKYINNYYIISILYIF